MRIVRLAGIALAAVLVLSLGAVAAASAMEPLFSERGISITGDSHLTVLIAGTNIIDCLESHFTGEITTIHLIEHEVIHYLGCTSTGAGGANCPVNSVGAAEGLILTNPLHGLLGLILPNDKIGILFSSVSPPGTTLITTLAKNVCTAQTPITGNVAGLIEPVGVLTLTGNILFYPGGILHIDLAESDSLKAGLLHPSLLVFGTSATLTQLQLLTYNRRVEVS
jgi:hypothetical protein